MGVVNVFPVPNETPPAGDEYQFVVTPSGMHSLLTPNDTLEPLQPEPFTAEYDGAVVTTVNVFEKIDVHVPKVNTAR
jgi:hypothetical protein